MQCKQLTGNTVLNKFILLINNKQIKFILFIICFILKILKRYQITIQLINAKLILYSLFLISYLSQDRQQAQQPLW
jgi:hypothetical protein